MKKYYVRSDLANESLSTLKLEKDYQRNYKHIGSITIEEFEVLRKHQSHHLDIGSYIEIGFKDYDEKKELIKQISYYLKQLIHKSIDKIDPLIMIIGLGNDSFTSDAIGPRSLKYIKATHHIDLSLRHEMHYYDIICTIPQVKAYSGVESADYVYALKEEFKPDLLIVIDALCAKSYDKVCRVIQMNNVGIYPGSGIGNHRKAINALTMDIPVIAIGVPTVIHVSSLVNEVFSLMEGYFKEAMDASYALKVGKRKKYIGKLSEAQRELIMGEIGKLNEEKRLELFYEILSPLEDHMILCDKSIDFDLEMLSKIISQSINELKY